MKGISPWNKKELFNLRHAVLQNVIEWIFGVVKQKWWILQLPPEYKMEIQVHILAALCAIHNLLWNLCLSMTSPTFSFLLTLTMSPSTSSSPLRTNIGLYPHLSPTPRSLRQNPIPIIDALLCFTSFVSDLLHSSTGPLVHWFPFLSHMFSSLDSAAALHSLHSTSSLFCFSFCLSLLQSLVSTLSYDSSLSLYDPLFPFLLGLCTPLYSI